MLDDSMHDGSDGSAEDGNGFRFSDFGERPGRITAKSAKNANGERTGAGRDPNFTNGHGWEGVFGLKNQGQEINAEPRSPQSRAEKTITRPMAWCQTG